MSNSFRTKVEFSRQGKELPKSITYLSGATVFGVPFSSLSTGPDLTSSGISYTNTNIISYFSGNSGSTVFTFTGSGMNLAASVFTAITPTTSGVTQNSGNIFTGNTFVITDGNKSYLDYTGISFDIKATSISEVSPGNYTGQTISFFVNHLYAGSIDYTGRTIWVDVSGITRTKDLIVSDSLVIGKNNMISSGITNAVILGGNNITATTSGYTYVQSLNIKSVGSGAFVNDIRIDGNGNLTTNTSDISLKEEIKPISNALNVIKGLKGVTYKWKDRIAGGNDTKLGFIAQEVNEIDTRLVFINQNDGLMGIHIDGIIPLLVEAIKELSNEFITSATTKIIETETITAEDNNILLNFGGNSDTAIGGGIKVLNSIDYDEGAEFILDEHGNWTTNINLKPKSISIPFYTPTSSNDVKGIKGNITHDENYIYVKVDNKWKRSQLEEF